MGRADIATIPMLSHGVRLCLHPRALVGSAYDGVACLWHTRACLSRTVGTIRVPCGMPELAAKPSHYAHFCALSRYGVTTEMVVPHTLFFGGIRDVAAAELCWSLKTTGYRAAADIAGLVNAVQLATACRGNDSLT